MIRNIKLDLLIEISKAAESLTNRNNRIGAENY